MRAIIFAVGDTPRSSFLHERHVPPLLPLVDRPFIQHVVECLVAHGISEFDFVLSHFPEQLENFLGDGTRWGSSFRFHLVRDAARPYRSLQTLATDKESAPVLLVHADRLPLVALDSVFSSVPTKALPVALCWRPEEGGHERQSWTGWALLSVDSLKRLSLEDDFESVEARLLAESRESGMLPEAPLLLNARSYADLLTAHQVVLAKKSSHVTLSGRERQPGVWISRNASLHPTVRVVPPVFIGANSRIGAGVQLGPFAAVGRDCIVSRHCTTTRSVVFPGSYVGEGLELVEALVENNCLINVRLDSATMVADDFILSSVTAPRAASRWRGVLSRVVGACLLALTWPILLGAALVVKGARRAPVFQRQEMVRLPVPVGDPRLRTFRLTSLNIGEAGPYRVQEYDSAARDFVFRFLPALVNVVRGDLDLVGVPPRTLPEIEALPEDWRALYLGAKAGIVTEAYARWGAQATQDERHAAEVFYAAQAGVRYDAKLLLAYGKRVLRALFSRSAAKTPLVSPSAGVETATLTDAETSTGAPLSL